MTSSIEKQTTKINQIVFDNAQLSMIEKDNELFVPLKPICDALELDWKSQHRNLQEDIVLSSTMVIMTIVAQDEKHREMVCLPLNYLNGWLFKINPARYEGERQARIIKYQKECYDALFRHFYPLSKEQLERKKLQVAGKRLDYAMVRTDLNIRKTVLEMEKQAEIEAMRIFRGNGDIQGLDNSPELQIMTQHRLEKLNRDSLFPQKTTGADNN